MPQSQRNFRQDFITFLSPVRHLTGPYAKIATFSLLEASFTIGSIRFLEQAVQSVEQGSQQLFQNYLLIYVVVVLIFYPGTYLLRDRFWEFYTHSQKRLHNHYVHKFILMDNNKAESLGTGRAIAILENGLTYWLDLLNALFKSGLRKSAMVIFSLLYISRIIGRDVRYIIAGSILTGLLVTYLNSYAIKRRHKRRDAKHSYIRSFVRIVMSKFEILQSQKIPSELANLDARENTKYEAHLHVADYMRAIFYIPLFLTALVSSYLVRKTGIQVLETGTGYGQLTALLIVTGMIGGILHDCIDFYRAFTKDRVYVEKIFDLFENTASMDHYNDGLPFVYKTGNIQLHQVHYGYAQDNGVFEDFSLKISGGKKTAFVGISGSGKSTLVKLISGYLQADQGKVLIDNQDLRTVSLKSYYQHIGYLTQDPSIFDGSVRENLLYAVEGTLDPSKLKHIIHLAKCDFIYDLPQGLDTEIGERGIRLSGGQRQRLAIAKIFLKDPEIIILDEPTSALDSFSEEAITEAMHNLFSGRTVLIIAHRLQTVKEADDIIVLDAGKVIERGTHDELVQQGGAYAKMLELQSGF